MVEAYLQGAKGRFEVPVSPAKARGQKKEAYYRIPHPGLLWEERDSIDSAPLPADSDLSARIEYQGHRKTELSHCQPTKLRRDIAITARNGPCAALNRATPDELLATTSG